MGALRVVVDTREQRPYGFGGYEVEIVRAALPAGDYSVVGLEDRVAVERKELNDLIGCLTTSRRRFEAELERARGYDLFVVMVEATWDAILSGRYRSMMNPMAAVASIAAFQVRYPPVGFWFAGGRHGAELATYQLLEKAAREIRAHYLVEGIKL